MERRRFLRLGAAGAGALLSGCSGGSSCPTIEGPGVASCNLTSSASSGDSGADPTATPTPTPSQSLSVADADFVVDQRGDGDYETLDEAYRVSQSGDTIGLRNGEYRFKPNAKKPVTVVGESRDDVALVLAPNIDESYGGSVITRSIFQNSGKRTTGVWRKAQVTFLENFSFVGLTVRSTAENGFLELQNGNLRFCTVDAYCRIVETPVKNCAIGKPAYFNQCTVRNCDLDNVGLRRTSVFNSRMALVAVGYVDVMDNEIANCEITGGTAYDGEQFALYGALMLGGGSSEGILVRDSVIRGRVGGAEQHPTVGAFVRNTFEDPDTEYYFDGSRADGFIANAFIDGDVRVTSASVKMFSEKHKVGNYYSAFDGTDEDGDGIYDLPRPIPGTEKVTDQYPLAKPAPSQYLTDVDAGSFSYLFP